MASEQRVDDRAINVESGELSNVDAISWSEWRNYLATQFIRIGGIGAEGFAGGVAAAYTTAGLTELSKRWGFNTAGSFFFQHLGSAAAGGLTFAALGTSFKIYLDYHKELQTNPDLTFAQFLNQNKGKLTKFMAVLWAVGGGSFAAFTMTSEYLATVIENFLFKAANVLASSLIGGTVGFGLFALACYTIFNEFPKDKLPSVAGVFYGFAIGVYLATLSTNLHVKTFVPAGVGAASGVAVNVAMAMGQGVRHTLCGRSGTAASTSTERTPLLDHGASSAATADVPPPADSGRMTV